MCTVPKIKYLPTYLSSQIVTETQPNLIGLQRPGISHSVTLPNAIPSLELDEFLPSTTVHI